MCGVRRSLAVLLYFLVCLYIDVHAEGRYSNKLLSDISKQLVDTYQINVVEGEIMLPSICPSKPLVVEKDSTGVINHVGVKLFDREFIRRYPSSLYHFVERYFLELLLLPSEQEIITKMRMERVKISSDIFSLKPLRKGILEIVAAFVKEPSFCIICNNNRYVVSCMVDNRLLVEVSMPVRYELISGFTKMEAENSVYMSLMSYQKRDYIMLKEDELFVYKDSLYCANDDYYLAEEIVSTSFYKKEKGGMVPVFSTSWLMESVCNLFNSLYDWGVEAEITQHLYGGKKISYTELLAKVMDFYATQGCKLYTGISKYDKSKIEGALIAINMELGYQHLLNFSFHKDLFKKPEKNQVKMKVYSYIPMHNVSSIFDENRIKK